MESALKEIQLHEHQNIETIRINALSGSVFLPDIIQAFKKTEPNVYFEVMEKRESTCWDVCIRSVLPEISYTSAERILQERILLAVHKDSWIANRQSVSLRDLEEEIFISLRKGTNLRDLADKRFQAEGFFPQQGFECDTLYILQYMVQGGAGVALWPEQSWGKIGPGSAFDQVRLVPIDLPDFSRSIYLIRSNDTKSMPVVARFCQRIRDYCADLQQSK